MTVDPILEWRKRKREKKQEKWSPETKKRNPNLVSLELAHFVVILLFGQALSLSPRQTRVGGERWADKQEIGECPGG
jgi:hypothetical protein